MEEIEYLLHGRNVKKAASRAKKLVSQLRSEEDIIYKIYGYIYRARTLAALKQYSKAHAYFKKAAHYVVSKPGHRMAGEMYYFWGMVYKQEHRLDKALKMFSEAMRVYEAIGNLRQVDRSKKEISTIKDA
jgi:tetratricopeptide (TPR) repeat protein